MTAPNVLFITVDQWRGDCLGALGHPLVQTPTLDRLAADGVLFANHYAQGAPCGPSRASLLTSTYVHTHRSVYNGTPLNAQLTNLALEARAVGYDPVLFGYTDTTIDPRTVEADDPRLRTYESPMAGFTPTLLLHEDRIAWYEWLETKGYDTAGRDKFLHRPAPYAAEHTETAFLVEQILDYLSGAPDPWFVHASFIRPHPPYVVPEPYASLVDPADVAPPVGELADHPFLAAAMRWEYCVPPTGDALRRLRATYYGMMREVDDQLGRLLDDVGEDAIVIVTSDHGEMLGDHGLMSKLGFYDGAFHIPCIVRHTALGGPKGVEVEGLHRKHRHHANAPRPHRRRDSCPVPRGVTATVHRRAPARDLARCGALGVRLSRLRPHARPRPARVQPGRSARSLWQASAVRGPAFAVF